MATYHISTESISNHYKTAIEYLCGEKERFNDGSLLAESINMNIILMTACYMESVFEGVILESFQSKIDMRTSKHIKKLRHRSSFNLFYRYAEAHIERGISQAAGIDRYDFFFKMCTGHSFKTSKITKEYIECVCILMQLRNMLAHGRMIKSIVEKDGLEKKKAHLADLKEKLRSAYKEGRCSVESDGNNFEMRFYDKCEGKVFFLFNSKKLQICECGESDEFNSEQDEEIFVGGYKQAETYLLKNNLISKKFIEFNGVNQFFSAKVASHFYMAVLKFIESLKILAAMRSESNFLLSFLFENEEGVKS